MIKLLPLFFALNAFGFVDPNATRSSYLDMEASLLFETRGIKDIVQENRNKSFPLKDVVLNDKENLVGPEFEIDPYFKDRVSFWFDIYTKYDSTSILIHDLDNLDLTYTILDFSKMFDAKLHRFTKAKLKSVLIKEYINKVKNALTRLSKGRFNKLNSFQLEILKKVKSAYGEIPRKWKKRKKFFLKLEDNIRSQTGQKDFIYAGLLRFQPYEKFLYSQLKNFKLPKEVLAISFLESSFNPKAISKVDASGVWQFMPLIGNLFLPRATKEYDYRESPIIASLGAFHLLKQNIQILKRWDLAITAYNSGTKHLIRARRMFGKKKGFNLPYVFENYESKHLGFASVNFYSEFLALAHVLAYKESLYALDGLAKKEVGDFGIYLAKCSFGPKSIKYIYKQSEINKELNQHINSTKKVFKKGFLVASSEKLSPQYYYPLSNKQLKRKFPKNYIQYLPKGKCGKL